MKVTITMPAYNEEESLGRVIKEIRNVMEKTDYNYSILVVDDGSKDRTVEVAKENNAIVFSGLLKTKLTDTTTGFRAFTKEVASLPLINTFTYTQEQLIRAGKAKMRVAEIPINTRKTRESRLFRNSFDYAVKAWINIFRIYRDFEPLRFFGVFGSIFIFIAILFSIFLAYTFITSGKVGHIPLTIVTALLYLMGVQIIVFGFLADMKK